MGGCAAMVLIVDPLDRPRVNPDRLSGALDLTPAQAHVAAAVASGGTVQSIAASSHRSEAVVRWHLKQIMARLGCSAKRTWCGWYSRPPASSRIRSASVSRVRPGPIQLEVESEMVVPFRNTLQMSLAPTPQMDPPPGPLNPSIWADVPESAVRGAVTPAHTLTRRHRPTPPGGSTGDAALAPVRRATPGRRDAVTSDRLLIGKSTPIGENLSARCRD